MDSRIVITPNFDHIYDDHAGTQTGGTISVKSYYDDDVAEVIRRGDRLILKMHGTISTPNNLIFSRNDYAKARIEHAHFYKILEALAITHTFLFLGAGINDPDIRLLLEDYAFRFRYSRKHYFILPKSALTEEEKEIMETGIYLYDTYDDSQTFAEKLRRNLASWKHTHLQGDPRIIRDPLSYNSYSPKENSMIEDTLVSMSKDLNEGLRQAKKLFDNGEKVEAELLYAKLVVSFDDPIAMIEYARVLRKMGNYQKASELLGNALSKAETANNMETCAYAWQQKGKIEECLGNYSTAKSHYSEALHIYGTLDKNPYLCTS